MMDDNKYLGTLCKRGHEYENTGMSLRYKKNRYCVECSKGQKYVEYKKIYRAANKNKINEYNKKYYAANIDKIRKYRLDNKDRIKEGNRKYRLNSRDKIREYGRKRDRESVRDLRDKYVKKQIGLKVSEITEEMIVLKREQLQLMRSIKQFKEELKDGTTRD